MMSYTMPCTSLCSSGGRLMRRTSPWTRIIGGRPDDRCKSDALFLTENARSSEMSIYNPRARVKWMKIDIWCQSSFESVLIMSAIPHNLQVVHARIAAAARAAARDPDAISLLAVSKTFGPDAVIEAAQAGQRAFGENYLQEALDK